MNDIIRASISIIDGFSITNNVYKTKIHLGFSALATGDCARASDIFDSAIEVDFDHSAAWLGKSLVEIDKTNFKENFTESNSYEIYFNKIKDTDDHIDLCKSILNLCLISKYVLLLENRLIVQDKLQKDFKESKRNQVFSEIAGAIGILSYDGKDLKRQILGGSLAVGGYGNAFREILNQGTIESSSEHNLLAIELLIVTIRSYIDQIGSFKNLHNPEFIIAINNTIESWKEQVIIYLNKHGKKFFQRTDLFYPSEFKKLLYHHDGSSLLQDKIYVLERCGITNDEVIGDLLTALQDSGDLEYRELINQKIDSYSLNFAILNVCLFGLVIYAVYHENWFIIGFSLLVWGISFFLIKGKDLKVKKSAFDKFKAEFRNTNFSKEDIEIDSFQTREILANHIVNQTIGNDSFSDINDIVPGQKEFEITDVKSVVNNDSSNWWIMPSVFLLISFLIAVLIRGIALSIDHSDDQINYESPQSASSSESDFPIRSDREMAEAEAKYYTITPKNEVNQDPTLVSFIQNLNALIYSKDSERLYDLFSENIISENTSYKKDDFVDNWDLGNKVSPFWDRIEYYIRLGGVFSQNTDSEEMLNDIGTFIYPFCHFEDMPSGCCHDGIVTGTNVNVRSKPTLDSDILGQMSYERVWLLEDNEMDSEDSFSVRKKNQWYLVENDLQGYVYGDYVYDGGYLKLTKVNSDWYISGFY